LPELRSTMLQQPPERRAFLSSPSWRSLVRSLREVNIANALDWRCVRERTRKDVLILGRQEVMS
jgi:hypothetical protein